MSESQKYPYQDQIEAAKQWLGKRYILAKPINNKKVKHEPIRL